MTFRMHSFRLVFTCQKEREKYFNAHGKLDCVHFDLEKGQERNEAIISNVFNKGHDNVAKGRLWVAL